VTVHAPVEPVRAFASMDRGYGCDSILSGSRSSRAREWHPPSSVLSSVDGPNVTAFDAPVATRVRRSAARAARTGFTVASSKAMASTTQGAFHRRVPRSTDPLARTGLERETRHRSRDFAAPIRLPALLRPLLPREKGLDPAASGRSSRPGAHGHAPLVDFCNRNDPQARPSDQRNPAHQSGRAAFAALPISRAGPARGVGRRG